MVKGLLILISSPAGTGVSVLMSSHRRVDNPSNNRIIIIIKRATVTFIEQLMYTRLRSTWHWILTASCEEDSVNPLGNEVLKKLSDLSNVTQLMTARIWTQTAEFLTVLFCIFLKTFSKKEVRSFFHIFYCNILFLWPPLNRMSIPHSLFTAGAFEASRTYAVPLPAGRVRELHQGSFLVPLISSFTPRPQCPMVRPMVLIVIEMSWEPSKSNL